MGRKGESYCLILSLLCFKISHFLSRREGKGKWDASSNCLKYSHQNFTYSVAKLLISPLYPQPFCCLGSSYCASTFPVLNSVAMWSEHAQWAGKMCRKLSNLCSSGFHKEYYTKPLGFMMVGRGKSLSIMLPNSGAHLVNHIKHEPCLCVSIKAFAKLRIVHPLQPLMWLVELKEGGFIPVEFTICLWR